MLLRTRTLALAAAAAMIGSASADAASDASGLWFDHNGRGAVEIAPCASGKGLCGYVVHIKEEKNAKRCGTQILGNVTPGGGGWIYSPERGKKYSVELSRLNDDKLRVVGNAGSFFSKTFTWSRAPDDIARCGETTAALPARSAETEISEAKATSASTPETAPITKTHVVGASSASLALLGTPKKRKADVTPTAAPDAPPAPAPAPAILKEPAVVMEKAPATKKAPPEKTAVSPVAVEDDSFVPERKCKFKIPYVGRVISVPCRD